MKIKEWIFYCLSTPKTRRHMKAEVVAGYPTGQGAFALIIAIAMTAFTASGSDLIPYIAMPVGTGYAIDAKGVRHPNAFCLRDAVYAPPPQFIHNPTNDPAILGDAQWKLVQGSGLYRLDIDLNTGRVVKVTTLKSSKSISLDVISTSTFKEWVFRPGKWKQITILTTVRKKWVAIWSN